MDDCTLHASDSMERISMHLLERAESFEDFESLAMKSCMEVCAAAMSAALERLHHTFFDERRPVGVRVHDIRERTQKAYRSRRSPCGRFGSRGVLEKGRSAHRRLLRPRCAQVRAPRHRRGGLVQGRGAYFPDSAEVVGHLDPRHLFTAIRKDRGEDPNDDAGDARILCSEGRIEEALAVLAKQPDPKGKITELATYIANNAHLIGMPSPTLGTIEADNATVYRRGSGGQRSWSREGLSAVASPLSAKSVRHDASWPLSCR